MILEAVILHYQDNGKSINKKEDIYFNNKLFECYVVTQLCYHTIKCLDKGSQNQFTIKYINDENYLCIEFIITVIHTRFKVYTFTFAH